MSETDSVEKKKVAEGIRLTGHVRVNRSPEMCYRYWRDFKNLPQFLEHIDSVFETNSRHSHWTVTGPADTSVDWDAEITEDTPGRHIAWKSIGEPQVKNSGSVDFKPADSGHATDLTVMITYDPPLGAFGEWFSELFGGNPDELLEHNLVLFKKAMETNDTGPALTKHLKLHIKE